MDVYRGGIAVLRKQLVNAGTHYVHADMFVYIDSSGFTITLLGTPLPQAGVVEKEDREKGRKKSGRNVRKSLYVTRLKEIEDSFHISQKQFENQV